MAQESTVVYLIKDNKVLLGLKKKGYSQGKWNGFGGKQEPGELIEDTATRELREESGLIANKNDLIKKAEFFYNEPGGNWRVHIFACKKWSGKIEESDEMMPKWFGIDKLPTSEMWENDLLWIKRVLTEDVFINGTFWHDEQGKVISYELS